MSDYLRDQLQSSLGTTYTLERELGGGGMSRVFVAEETRFRRRVVIKVLTPELAAGITIERFEREIMLAATLQQAYIVPVISAGEVNGLPWYSMPFVEGESLRARMERGPMSFDEVVSTLRDVARALSYAHERGIVHRDIKPENVLLSSGTAVVTDFGIAKALNVAATNKTSLTQHGGAIGTPAYMAPEQASGDPATDHRADVYAWGMMGYEMLAGVHPFADKHTPHALIAAQLVQRPAHIIERCPGLAPHVASLIMRCLKKEPEQRPETASELVNALTSTNTTSNTPSNAMAVGATMVTPRVSATLAASDRTMVVLPFANLSADPENEYFSDGLTDEVIADLSRVRTLKVISRSSAMQFKGSGKGAREIAEQLGVRYVLEGSVRKAGDNLRITARLVDAHSDTQCWADKYTGVLADVFDLQERVSREIVNALGVTLSGDEEASIARRSIDDVAAYDCYLRARHELEQASPASIERAVALIEQGISLVGENPRLRATRAYLDVLQMRIVGHMDPVILDRVATQSQEVLRTDPKSGPAYFVLGLVDVERGRLPEASASLQRALQLEPHHVETAVWLGILYIYAGQVVAARKIFDRLRMQDPLSPFPHGLMSAVEWFDGQFAGSLKPAERCLELAPESTLWRWHLGYSLALNGRVAEAAAQAEHMWRTDPLNPYSRHLKSLTLALQGQSAAAREFAREFDVAKFDAHLTFHVAECHAMAGEHERALTLLEESIPRGFYPFPFIERYDPFLAPLRSNVRWAVIVRETKRLWEAFVV